MDTLVSIIVPVYCVEKYLDECISSLVEQTHKNIEIILIDDGSTDRSSAICDEWSTHDNRIIVIHNKNHGVSYSRNCGLDIAKGEYIAFCDSDDKYEKSYVSVMLEKAKEFQSDITICGYSCLKNGNVISFTKEKENCIISKEEIARNIFLNNEIGGFMWNKLFRKKILKGIKFNSKLQICEDTYFLFEVLNRPLRVCWYNKPLYYYRLSGTSAVGNVNNICSEAHRSKYTEVFEMILKNYTISEKTAKYIKSGIFMLAVSVLCDYKNSGGKDSVFKKNLNANARKYLNNFLKCKEVPLKKKIITIGNWLFNLRRFKCK
ncbi:MAG: glycosyltransferase family 2 protein [Ruminococcus sp.]|nr:glycosyltransferase family 2 protein [Ruminococcus sp.]